MVDEENVSSTIKEVPYPPLQSIPKLPLQALYKAEQARRQASIDHVMPLILSLTKKQTFNVRWEELSKEKEKLKSLFVEANKTVKENKASMSRFFEIIKEQRKNRIKLQQDIIYTQEEIDQYMEVKELMEKYVRQYSIFENFLEDVAAAATKTGDLPSTRDILNRYETLEAARSELARILAVELEVEAQMRQQMIELLEDKSTTLKALSNRLVMLQVTKRQAMDCRIYWEMIVQRIKKMILNQEQESVVLHGASWDLYNQVCERRKTQPTVPIHDIKAQLDYIQKSVVFFKDVLTIATGGASNDKDRIGKMKKKKQKK